MQGIILQLMNANLKIGLSVLLRMVVSDGLLEGHTPTGTEELRAFVKVCNEAFGNMRHLTTNEIINVSGNSATQKCYLLFFNDLDNRVEGHICVYNDTLVRQDGEWKYSRRDVELKMKYWN